MLRNEGLLRACPDYVFDRLFLLFLAMRAKRTLIVTFDSVRLLGRLAEEGGEFILVSHVPLVLLLPLFLPFFGQPLRPRKPCFVFRLLVRWRSPTAVIIIVHKSVLLISHRRTWQRK